MHYAKWKKPHLKGYFLYASTSVTFWKRKTAGALNRSVVARGWESGKEMTTKGQDALVFWGVWELFHTSMVVWLY